MTKENLLKQLEHFESLGRIEEANKIIKVLTKNYPDFRREVPSEEDSKETKKRGK